MERLVGDEPPYHVPTFVLTHHAREPIEYLARGPRSTSQLMAITLHFERPGAAAGELDA